MTKSQKFYVPVVLILLIGVTACSPKSDTPVETAGVASESTVDSAALAREAELEAARRDSIRQALEATRISYDEEGTFAIQLSAWRSMEKAEEIANEWKEKGFQSSFVVESGREESGDIWYRVRIGNFADREMAERAKSVLAREHGTESWVIDLSADPVAAGSNPI
jgi:cell division septation protein DedD